MEGRLSIEQLKTMGRKELQALAKELKISAGGKNEEIIARIAAVEVDVPEESELTEDEKATSETAEQDAAEQEDPEQADEKVAEEQKARENTEETEGLVKVKTVTRFLDKQFNQIKDAGEIYSVSKERAAELVAAGVAEIVG